MTCEDVRAVLPELAQAPGDRDGLVSGADVLAVAASHVEGCRSCSVELAAYRALLGDLASLRDVLLETSPLLLPRVLAAVAEAARHRRVVASLRAHPAGYSVGGAVVGAAVVGIVWWRLARHRGIEALTAPNRVLSRLPSAVPGPRLRRRAAV